MDEDLERYDQLPGPPELLIVLPKQAETVQKLQLKLQECLKREDLSKRANQATVNFYKTLFLAELLIYGELNIGNLVYKIQKKCPGEIGQQAYLAAFKVIYDWVTTGGVNTAKIGEPFE